MKKLVTAEVSSFDQLCTAAEFDLLICRPDLIDPRDRESRLYDPDCREAVKWSDFFVWPVLLTGGEFNIADGDDPWLDVESPYAALQETLALVAAGATVILTVDASSLRNLMFATCFLSRARIYATSWLGEDDIGDVDYAAEGWSDVKDENGDVVKMFCGAGILSYNSRHPFPVLLRTGRIRGRVAELSADAREAVVWHRRFALGGTDDRPDTNSVQICPELWQGNYVSDALDDGENFLALAWMPGNRIVSFAQRLGKGSIIVTPTSLLAPLRTRLVNWTPGFVPCWRDLTHVISDEKKHFAADPAQSDECEQKPVPRKVVVDSKEKLWIRFPSVRTMQIKFGKEEDWLDIRTEQLNFIQGGKATKTFRLLIGAYDSRIRFTKKELGTPNSRRQQLLKLKDTIGTHCRRLHLVDIEWGNRFAVVKTRGDQQMANFIAINDTDCLGNKKAFNDGINELCEARSIAASERCEQANQ